VGVSTCNTLSSLAKGGERIRELLLLRVTLGYVNTLCKGDGPIGVREVVEPIHGWNHMTSKCGEIKIPWISVGIWDSLDRNVRENIIKRLSLLPRTPRTRPRPLNVPSFRKILVWVTVHAFFALCCHEDFPGVRGILVWVTVHAMFALCVMNSIKKYIKNGK
jgi:hypothetical protein